MRAHSVTILYLGAYKALMSAVVELSENEVTVAKDEPKFEVGADVPGLPSANRGADKYQRILDAAVAVFAEKGFFTSRVSDIADRADVADGTVYLYFKSKEEILMTAINTAFDAFMSLARTELKKLSDPVERLRRLAFLHLDALGSNRNMAVVFQMELRQSTRFLSEFSHQHMVEYLGLVREAILEGQDRGIFRREMSDKYAANCFFGALDEMVTSWVLSEHEYQLSNVADVVVDIFLNGMRTA
jgi:TetR/AcrR family transcriptional regulator, fatty acid metabolism regulator protein